MLASSYVGARVVTVVWRPDGWPWWRPTPALLLLPDMLGAEDHRQLRVALRCGRAPPASGRAVSYDPAGPTVSAIQPAARAISGEAAG